MILQHDFILFILTGIDEVHHKIANFFSQLHGNVNSNNLDFFSFLEEERILEELNEYVNSNAIPNLEDLSTIYDMFVDKDIENIIRFLNFYKQGYDDEGRGTQIELSVSEIEAEWENYLNLKKSFPHLHISFFRGLVNQTYNFHIVFDIEENFKFYNEIYENNSLDRPFKENLIATKRKDLFDLNLKRIPQLVIPINVEAFVFDELSSIENFCRNATYDFKYTYPLTCKKLNYGLFEYNLSKNIDIYNDQDSNNEDSEIQIIFKDLKSANVGLISFLIDKGFNSLIIENLLNLLSRNYFKELESIIDWNVGMTELMRILYSFYILDYFKIVGYDISKDKFYEEEILEFYQNSVAALHHSNDLGKYYRAKENNLYNNKNYIFNESKMSRFYKNIERVLNIEREKLKPVLI